MKNIINVFRFTLLVILMSQTLVSCRKDDENNNLYSLMPNEIVSLNDSLLFCNENDSLRYDLDIDGDNIIDISFNQKTSLNGSSPSIYYTSMSLGENYEVLTMDYSIPYWVKNVYNDPMYGDTAFGFIEKRMPINVPFRDQVTVTDFGFEQDSIDITYAHINGTLGIPSSNKIFNQLLLDEDVTIVLKKTEYGREYLGWIKIKILSFAKIELKSYREMVNAHSIIIG